MHYYLYEIRNNINDKIYIGVHKTINLDDGYMGSGSRIKSAIKKYGLENFTKSILEKFDSSESMFSREKEIVNQDFLLRSDVYNLKLGGEGGFDHINYLPSSERKNFKILKEKISLGEISVGGIKNWTEESFKKVAEQAKLNNELGLTSGWHHTAKFKQEQSARQRGNKNSQFGTIWCVLENAENCENRKKFKKENIPLEYISVADWKDSRKKKNAARSRHWYNDSIKNYYLYPDDDLIVKSCLIRGRLV